MRIVPAKLALSFTRLLLAGTVAGLLAGVLCQIAGLGTLGDDLWAATATVTLAPAAAALVRGLFRRSPGLDVIVVLAIAGALGLGEFLAAAVIGLMVATGRALEEFAANRAERELKSLLQRAPRMARRVSDGGVESVPVEAVVPGDILVINEGDVVPVDGVVTEGGVSLDESALTGESRLVERNALDPVRSGVLNVGASFQLRATTTSAASTYAGIIRMVREAQTSKAPIQRLADKYALWFVPLTLGVAAVAWGLSGSPTRALAVLVVATPCPLLLAAPVAVISGVSRAARRGIIVKGGGAMETLARGKVLFLDKTGTITRGRPELQKVVSANARWGEADLLRLAASLDQMSSHVFADALVHAARKQGMELTLPTNVHEVAGAGVEGMVGDRWVRAGKLAWATYDSPSTESRGFVDRATRDGGSTVVISVDRELAGLIVFEDPIRPDAARAIRVLKRLGIQEVVMLTGDRRDVAEPVGAALGIDEVRAELAPGDKVAAVRDSSLERVTLMVGDGINDAPALAAADVGIAMGARGSASSSESADVVLVVDRLDRLVEALQIARRSRSVAVQSIFLGMGLSLVAMGFAAAGLLPPVVGAFLQEGIDALSILNALRALRGRDVGGAAFQLPPELARTLRCQHEELAPMVESLREFADGLGEMSDEAVAAELPAVRSTLDAIFAHERADESEVYSKIATGLGGEDPLAAMSGAHREIVKLGRSFQRIVDGLEGSPPDPHDVVDLRRILYALHTVIRLNISQEDELYMSLDVAWTG